jgi:cell division septation protein DedD
VTFGGKRGAGERVLESKHVIGLFLLMLLFSGVFFSLGYVMGRNQYDGQVRAAMKASRDTESEYPPKTDVAPKKITEETPPAGDSDPATDTTAPAWNFPSSNNSKVDAHTDSVPANAPTTPAAKPPKTKAQAQTVAARVPVKNGKSMMTTPFIPTGSYVIQVAALLRQDDALTIAGNLQKKHYSAYVQTRQRDKYYRVQVGPFRDQKSAESAKKGLQEEGFKAFYVKH